MHEALVGGILILMLLLPMDVCLVWGSVPVIVLGYYLEVPPLLSVGDARVRLDDLVVLVVAVKLVFFGRRRPRGIGPHPAYDSIVAFFGCLLIATIVAGLRFGTRVFVPEVIALCRLTLQAVFLVLLVASITTIRQAERIVQSLNWLGLVVGATVYLNAGASAIGWSFGETFRDTQGAHRYIGIVGDQVGFLIGFFVLKSIVEGKVLRSAFFVMALALTGTRGALFPVGVGIAVLFASQRHLVTAHRRGFHVALAGLLFLGLAVSQGLVGPLRLRFERQPLRATFDERVTTAKLALQLFGEQPLFGGGFTALRLAAEKSRPGLYFAGSGLSRTVYPSTNTNQYLQVASDAGILGLGAFAWMMVNVLRVLRLQSRDSREELRVAGVAAYCWVLGLLIGNQTAGWLLPGSCISYLFWTVTGLAMARESGLAVRNEPIRVVRLASTLPQVGRQWVKP